jgi:hypothetical protein
VIGLDSLSHAWIGKDGALEQVDKAAERDPRNNSFTAWRNVTPKHNKLVDTMLSCKAHLIATIRAKTEFVQEKNASWQDRDSQDRPRSGAARRSRVRVHARRRHRSVQST